MARGSWWSGVTLVLLLLVSSVGAALVALPETATKPSLKPSASAAQAVETGFSLHMEEIELRAKEVVAELGGTRVPAPDTARGYADLPSEAKFEAWQAYVRRAALDQRLLRNAPFPSPMLQQETPAPAGASDAKPAGLPESGLVGLWSRDSHGEPQQLVAGPDGRSFLITDEAVLGLAAGAVEPDWMIKPEDWITWAESTSTLKPKTQALVFESLGGWAIQFGPDGYTVTIDQEFVVLDARTGTVISQWVPSEGIVGWSLSHVDGDGDPDLLGLTVEGELTAYSLAGKLIHSSPIEGLPEFSQNAGVAYVYGYSSGGYGLLADVNGDEALDLVVGSSYEAGAFAVVDGASASAGYLAAYSGKDGTRLWIRPAGAGIATEVVPMVGGDMTKDGRAEVLYAGFNFIGAYVWPAGAGVFYESMVGGVLDGRDGSILATESIHAYAVSTPVGGYGDWVGVIDWEPMGIGDLDDDGTAEIVGLSYDGEGFAIVGQALPQVPGASTTRRYTLPFQNVPGDIEDGLIGFMNTDAEPNAELVAMLFTVDLNEEGRPKAVHLILGIAGKDALAFTEPAKPLGFFASNGVDPALYGFELGTDRWGRVDAAGAFTGTPFELVTSTYPDAFHEVTGDSVPDVLTRTTLGYRWVDGREGSSKSLHPRVLGTMGYGLQERAGAPVLLERQLDRSFALRHISGQEIWRLPTDVLGPEKTFSLTDVADLDGDPELEAVLRSSDSGTATYHIYDPAQKKMLAEYEDIPFPEVYDLLPARPGMELLSEDSADVSPCFFDGDGFECPEETEEEGTSLTLRVPEKKDPVWAVNISGDENVRLVESGIIYTRAWVGGDEDEARTVWRAYDSTNMRLQGAFSSKPRQSLAWARTVEVNAGAADLMLTTQVEPEDPEAKLPPPEMVVWDGQANKTIAKFALDPHPEEDEDDESGFISFGGRASAYIETIGDVDGDALSDLVLVEKNQVTIRSTGTGQRLAVGPQGLSASKAIDLNGDGVKEIAFFSSTGQLRMATYSKDGKGLGANEPLRLVEEPQKATTLETGAGEFFEEKKENGIPGFEAVLALIGLLALALRRRGRLEG